MKLDIDCPPERVAEILEIAKQDVPKLFEIERKARTGQQGDGNSKWILWNREGKFGPVFSLLPTEELPMDEKYANAALVKVLMHCRQIPVAAFMSEAWMASRCAICGEPIKDGGCGHKQSSKVSENPYRREMTIVQLSAYPGDEMTTWIYEIKRNEFGVVQGYAPYVECQTGKADGRMAHYWDLQVEEAPIFAHAYPAFAAQTGAKVPGWVKRLRDLVEMSGVKLPRFGVTDDVDGFSRVAHDPEDN